MDLLLAGYGSSDDEDETQQKEDVEESTSDAPTTTSSAPPKPSSTLFSKLPAPSATSTSSSSSSLFSRLPPPSASSSASSSNTSKDEPKSKGKRTVSLMLPISKEALRGKYEDEFMHQSGPALPEAPKPTGLSALLPAPKNPNPAKRQRMTTPAAVVRRQMEQTTDDKSAASTSTTSESEAKPATEARQPSRSLRAAPPAPSATSTAAHQYHQASAASAPAPTTEYGAHEAAYGAYPGYESYYQHGYQQQGAYPGYAQQQTGYDYYQQQAQPQAPLGDLPEPPPETGLFILQFTREWEHLAKGARIVDVSQAQITDTSGWSKEFIQENLAKATSSVSAKDQPRGIQKRKHQITSLAFEAKQREMELLNQRANARKTKSETWGKYGW